MAAVRLPQAVRPGVQRLTELEDGVVSQLAAALAEVPPTAVVGEFIDGVMTRVESSMDSSAREIVMALLSLAGGRDQLQESIAEFSSGVADSRDLDLSPEQRSALNRALLQLLKATPLIVTAKAGVLLNQQSNTFTDARVITEARPVFGDSASAPAGMLLLHNLRISFMRDQEDFDFYVTLNARELEELQETLSRASAKQQSLREFLDRTEVPVLSVDRGDDA